MMEILNNIWSALTTENGTLIDILSTPLTILELCVFMHFFLVVLSIKATVKQKRIYLAFSIPIGLICNFIIPKPYSNLLTLFVTPFIIMYIFKTSLLKSVLAELLPVGIITVLELFLTKCIFVILDTDYDAVATIPLVRVSSILFIYSIILLLTHLSKKFNFNVGTLDSLEKKSKRLIIINMVISLIVIFIQMYLIVYYNERSSIFIVLLNLVFLIAYFVISISTMVKTMKLEKTEKDLEQEKNYNKTLQIFYDNIRGFKHVFANIISGIGGYVSTNDMQGLDKYYHQLLLDCQQNNNLESLNPETINNPAIYSVLANKYYKADNLGITISLECFIDFKKLHMEIYEFTRILGILMDNAIEASQECDEKQINVIIREEPRRNRQLLIVENTYKNKDVDIEKIYEKGYSTKEHNTGLGLWEVNKIISRRKNLSRFTSKTNKFFKQQIEIYNE